MPTIRIPTPLRPYTGGQAQIEVSGNTVGAVLRDLTAQYPPLRQHLFTDSGELRAFVNVFLGQEDVRHMQGENTPVAAGDQLRIVPSVAGGQDRVDHSALRVNQTFIIALLMAAFVLESVWLAALVALVMTLGTVTRRPGFRFAYALALKPLGIVKPDIVPDNPEPHVFSQGLGAAFVGGGVALLWAGASVAGWALVWIVIALASLNLFGGFCVGCFVYYWLARAHVPGFAKNPPPNTFPGMKPK